MSEVLTDSGTLNVRNDWLLVFVDDTGHEHLKGHTYYGLGGVAVLAEHYETIVKPCWREVRRLVTGSPDAQLHASEFGQNPKPEGFDALEVLFRIGFNRFGVAATAKTEVPSHLSLAKCVMVRLKRVIEDLARDMPIRTVALFVESSQRADPLIEQHFERLTLLNGGRTVAVEHCFMPKSSREIGLEIADFVVNATGSGVRHRLAGREAFPKDFQQVFCNVPPAVAHFVEMAGVSGQSPYEISWEFVLGSTLPSMPD